MQGLVLPIRLLKFNRPYFLVFHIWCIVLCGNITERVVKKRWVYSGCDIFRHQDYYNWISIFGIFFGDVFWHEFLNGFALFSVCRRCKLEYGWYRHMSIRVAGYELLERPTRSISNCHKDNRNHGYWSGVGETKATWSSVLVWKQREGIV